MWKSVICAAVWASSLLGASAATGDHFNAYLEKDEAVYKWHNTGADFITPLGHRAHVLNVTSQTWLDETKAVGPNGAVWTHQVVVIEPLNSRLKGVANAYLTGNCNEHPSNTFKATDEDIVVADNLSLQTGSVSIVVFQIPNCHIVYPSDPSKRGRSEDAMIAWAWRSFLAGNGTNPEWLPRFPMAKGAFQSMRAVSEFLTQDFKWTVAGASKRGWTTWMVGAATCKNCVEIQAIVPLVPIVPHLEKIVHHQYKSYGGLTFAFKDYTQADVITYLDSDVFHKMAAEVDPKNYYDRLGRLPKMVVESSDDEFMMMEWTQYWYADMVTHGETHLLIAPNSEHSLATGIPEVLESLGAFIRSVESDHARAKRPDFSFTHDADSGLLTVTIPDAAIKPTKVVMRHSQTLSSVRRDFRWLRANNTVGGDCKFPEFGVEKGELCFVPIIWFGTELTPVAGKPNEYHATPPRAVTGHWTGYYVELFYASDTGGIERHMVTTPGYVHPDTFPFPDCSGSSCASTLV